ncbi:MAG: YARHG domain-containing protein [Chitinophagaceae bacterium]|nr:YARHG domain-containing protein [Chitinophagaceae bacterium]
MKIYFAAVTIFLGLSACNSNVKSTEEKKENSIATVPASQTIVNSPLLGSYVGPFGDNKITLLITKVIGDTVEGRSVVGGNDRPFSGLATKANGIYTINAKEPGDDKYDGQFSLSFDEKNTNAIKGNWKPFKEGSHGGAKDFSLTRNTFKYLVDVGQYPQASKRLLKEDDVANMIKEDLEIMRNEIFARHGYCFKKKHLREQFEDKDWYIPNTVDVKNDLTEIEKKNIALIKKYEKYAEEYGNDFGR